MTRDDLISRQAMREAMYHEAMEKDSDEQKWDGGCWIRYKMFERVVEALPSAPQWIPVKTRPMTQEEREYYELTWDTVLDDEEAVLFDCKMPEDKQTIWVTTKNGYLFQDTCENDDGYIGLEGNGDWYDIVAWMPVLVPEPYKENSNDKGRIKKYPADHHSGVSERIQR